MDPKICPTFCHINQNMSRQLKNSNTSFVLLYKLKVIFLLIEVTCFDWCDGESDEIGDNKSGS